MISDFRYHAFLFCFELLNEADYENFQHYLGSYLNINEFQKSDQEEFKAGTPLLPLSDLYSLDAARFISLMLGMSAENRKRRLFLIFRCIMTLNLTLAWKHINGYVHQK
jgi:hypothetical protein